MKRADGLEACVDLLPGVAKLMASIWGPAPRGMRLFVEVASYIWRYFHIYGSLIQDGQDGPPVWCLVLHVVLVTACSGLFPEIAADVWFFIFIDDLSISVSTRYALEVLMRIENVAARYGMVLKRTKSAVHVPAWKKDEVGELLAVGAEEALGVE